jgi:hypothetical protein
MVRGQKGRRGKTPGDWHHAGFFYPRIPHVREVFTGGASEAQHALHGSHSSGVKPFSTPKSANTRHACVKLRPRDTSQIAIDTIDYV